jgi:hypothetical protein
LESLMINLKSFNYFNFSRNFDFSSCSNFHINPVDFNLYEPYVPMSFMSFNNKRRSQILPIEPLKSVHGERDILEKIL